ncbi:aldo/keto reductase [Thermodesulfobacteriota bacterium]
MQSLTFNNNDKMPILGLGTWKAEPGDVGKAVQEAVRIGYRHIDCAAIYGNEAEIGKALQEVLQTGLVKRDELWITSKLWNNAHAREEVSIALEKTLADLRLDYLDLYLIHWPVATRPDVIFPRKADDFFSLAEMPLNETWAGMEDCVESRLAKHIGVSNFSIKKIEALSSAKIRPEVNQIELHPYLQQEEMLNYCKKHNIYLTAYSPLGSGDRPEAMKAANEPSLLENSTVVNIAQAHGCNAAQVLLKWAIERGTSVIPKSTNPGRLAENLDAANLKLGNQEMAELAKLERGFRYVNGEFWTMEGSPYTLAELWG